MARDIAEGKPAPAQPAANLSLLDLEDDYGTPAPKSGLDAAEKENIRQAYVEAVEKVDRLRRVTTEMQEVMKDLKEKVSHALLVPSVLMIRSKRMMCHLYSCSIVAVRVSSRNFLRRNLRNSDRTKVDSLLAIKPLSLFCKSSKS
jgi:hypothetical protein